MSDLDVDLRIQALVTGMEDIERINAALADQRIASLQAASATQDLSTAEGQAARLAIDAALAAERKARALTAQAQAARAAANAAAAIPNQTPAQQAAAQAANAHATALEHQALAARASATALGQQAIAANTNANANTNAGNAASTASAGFGKMLGALASITVAMAGLGKLVEIADGFKLMESRVALATEKLGDSTQAMTDIRAIASEIGAPLEAVANLYGRIAIASDQLGLSQENVAKFTQAVSKAFVVSGASTAEMTSSLRQLAQALASGVLRGDEFNSIMENAPRIQQALADSLGKTKGDLIEMAREGKLSAETITKALLEQSAAIDEEFAKVPDTVGAAWQAVANEFARFIDIINDGTGATSLMAAALRGLAGVFTDIQVFGIDTAQIFTDLAARFNYVVDILNTPIDGNTLDAVAERTRKLDDELKKIAAEYGILRAEAIKAGEAGAQVSDKIAASTKPALTATETLTAALKAAGGEGEKAGKAIKEALAGIDIASTAGVLAISEAMRGAGENAKLLGDQITEWISKANNADLSKFAQSVQAAFDAGAIKAEEFSRYNDEILTASFKKLGLDAETELGRITPAVNDGIASLRNIAAALDNTLDAPEAKMRALEAAVTSLIDKAKTATDVEVLAANIEDMGKKGDLSKEALARLNSEIDAQKLKIYEATPGINSLAEAYKTLGITAPDALKKTADETKAAYEKLVAHNAELEKQPQTLVQIAVASEGVKKAIGNVFTDGKEQAADYVQGLQIAIANLKTAQVEALKLKDGTAEGEAAYTAKMNELNASLQTAQGELKKTQDSMAGVGESAKQAAIPLATIQEAFLKYAETAIKANGGVADSALTTKAAQLGLKDAVIAIEQAVIKASPAMKDLEEKYKAAGEAAKQESDAIKRSADAHVAAAKTALDNAKAKGDENEISRASAVLAQAEADAAYALAQAKYAEAEAAAAYAAEVERALVLDGAKSEADQRAIANALAKAAALRGEADAQAQAADAAQDAANAATESASKVVTATASAGGGLAAVANTVSTTWQSMAQQAGISADQIQKSGDILIGVYDKAAEAQARWLATGQRGSDPMAGLAESLRQAADSAQFLDDKIAQLKETGSNSNASLIAENLELKGQYEAAAKVREDALTTEIELNIQLLELEAQKAALAGDDAAYQAATKRIELLKEELALTRENIVLKKQAAKADEAQRKAEEAAAKAEQTRRANEPTKPATAQQAPAVDTKAIAEAIKSAQAGTPTVNVYLDSKQIASQVQIAINDNIRRGLN